MANSFRFPIWCRKSAAAALIAAMLAPAVPRMAAAQPAGLPDLGESFSQELSPYIEQRLGEAIMFESQHDPDFIQDPDIQQYLTDLGAKLVAFSPGNKPTVHVFPVRDPEINAFAMPGGYVGVNAGLVVAARSESELAGVLAHEIGHVVQRHIARGMTQQKQDAIIMVASLLAALVAARSSSQAPEAALAFGQAAAIDSELGFSRGAEREADRTGFVMLSGAGFDVNGMADFFGRLMQMSGINESTTQVFARTHPLSIERMSDMQNRAREAPHRQYVDSPDFYFVQAKMHILETGADAQATFDTIRALESRARDTTGIRRMADLYGVAVGWMQRKEYAKAKLAYQDATSGVRDHFMLAELASNIALAQGNAPEALSIARNAFARWPDKRGLAYAVAQALQASGKDQDAVDFLRQQVARWSDEAPLYQMLAISYGKLGNAPAQRTNMADYYVYTGALPSAIEQLQQARTFSKDFYEQSQIDARIRDLQRTVKEEEDLLKRFKS
jgi:predicted Zn-dependent protease